MQFLQYLTAYGQFHAWSVVKFGGFAQRVVEIRGWLYFYYVSVQMSVIKYEHKQLGTAVYTPANSSYEYVSYMLLTGRVDNFTSRYHIQHIPTANSSAVTSGGSNGGSSPPPAGGMAIDSVIVHLLTCHSSFLVTENGHIWQLQQYCENGLQMEKKSQGILHHLGTQKDAKLCLKCTKIHLATRLPRTRWVSFSAPPRHPSRNQGVPTSMGRRE